MPRSVWPKFDGGETLEEYARRQLGYGDNTPFDGVRSMPEGGFELPANEKGDWATRAARGIIEELGERGGSFGESFHPERVVDEARIEIVDVMAAIMREALKQAHN